MARNEKTKQLNSIQTKNQEEKSKQKACKENSSKQNALPAHATSTQADCIKIGSQIVILPI